MTRNVQWRESNFFPTRLYLPKVYVVQNSTQAITPTYQQSKIFQADDKSGMTSANIETNHVQMSTSSTTTKSDSELSLEFYENLKNAFKDYYTTTI